MLEEIVDIRNVQKAFRQVTASKGAGGMDGSRPMNFETTNRQTLRTTILEGNYHPRPVKR